MKKIFIFLFVLPILISGCSSASIKAYVSPSFKPGLLKSVAIFPMLNVKMLPDETRQINNEIIQAFSSKNPNVIVIRPEESVELLSKASLSDKYTEFLKNYSSSGVPNISTLKEIGIALNVDAIIQGEMYNFVEIVGSIWQWGSTSLTIRYVMLSTINGDVLWDAMSSAKKEKSAVAIPIYEVIKIASDQVLSSLPEMGK
ncbi:MAG: hypothetical protein A2014_00070 [Spirochaetes bacterium GWF1_49_6]|nr:MAG: hypothetical protein A2014_00070 [Spirochaetes bacterium GWF1_49_6]